MRGPILALSVMGACGFTPTATFEPADAPNVRDAVHADSDLGSGSGSGSGSAQACTTGDDDQDGVCNGDDDWPCGAKPGSPDDFHITGFGYDYRDSNVKLDGQGKLAVIEPGTAFSVDFDYSLTVPCATGTTCHVVIETGTQAGKQGCGSEANVVGQQVLVFQIGTTGGHAANNLTIGTPGQYRILSDGSKATACGSSWIQGSPSNDFTLGFVCVHHHP
ncbi:MAG: hypothetical protein ABI678_22055 [Kofleriaceae bacterium]